MQPLEDKLQAGQKGTSADTGKQILPSGVCIASSLGMSTSQKSKKHRPKPLAIKDKDEITIDNIMFKGLNGIDCRNLWAKTPQDDLIKKSLRQAQVHWAVQMPIFLIKDFEVVLRAMIGSYDRHHHQSIFDYQHQRITVSFTTDEFTRVFGIPRIKGKKIDTSQKISLENRATLLR